MGTNFWDLVEKEKKKKFGYNSGLNISNTSSYTPSGAFGDLVKEQMFKSSPSTARNDDIAPIKTTVGTVGKTEEDLLEGMTPTQRMFHNKVGGFVDTETSFADQTERVTKLILEGKDTNYTETDKLLKQLKARQDYYKQNDLTYEKEETELQGYYNKLIIAKNQDILSKTKMDGQNHSVLEEMQLLTNLSGDEKEKRKEAVFKKMEELGIPTEDYALFTDDKNFDWSVFWNWAKSGVSAGLNSAWLGLAKTAHMLTFQNPVTEKVVDFYQGNYNLYHDNAQLYMEQLGGGGG
jgi:hypothetical protein